MKKLHSKRKRWLSLIAVMLVLIIILTIVVGNFFVNYALVPGEGGQNRNVTTDVQVDNPTVIEQNRQIVQVEVDQWLEGVEALTEDVTIQSHDGLDLKGKKYLQEDATNLWVIIVHGYQSNAEWSLDYAPYYYDQGYNVLSISLRAHGPSQGDYIGMGYLYFIILNILHFQQILLSLKTKNRWVTNQQLIKTFTHLLKYI